MARYIDEGALKKALKRGGDYTVADLLDILEDIPTADVAEARHGRWVLVRPRRTGRNATYRCTVCKKLRSSYYNDVQEWEYCPCGAKMDGGAEG